MINSQNFHREYIKIDIEVEVEVKMKLSENQLNNLAECINSADKDNPIERTTDAELALISYSVPCRANTKVTITKRLRRLMEQADYYLVVNDCSEEIPLEYSQGKFIFGLFSSKYSNSEFNESIKLLEQALGI